MKRILIVITILFTGIGVLLLINNSNDSATDKNSEYPEEKDIITNYRKISAREAKNIMQSDDPHIILDVRTEEEFNESHIPNAILIPEDEIKERIRAEVPDKNMVILIYCRSGSRSEKSARKLIAMGYRNVFDFGGIIDWPYLLTISQDESYETF